MMLSYLFRYKTEFLGRILDEVREVVIIAPDKNTAKQVFFAEYQESCKIVGICDIHLLDFRNYDFEEK